MASFSKLELQTIQVIALTIGNNYHPFSVSKIAETLGVSKSAASRALAALEQKGLIESEKGRKKTVKLARDFSIEPFLQVMGAHQLINRFPSSDFSKIFENSNFQVLSALCYRESASFSSIIRVTGLTEITARRSLSKLRDRGVVNKKKNRYGIILPALTTGVQDSLRKLMARREGIAGNISMQIGPYGFIRSAAAPSEELVTTGLSLFPKYGISLVSDINDFIINEFFKPKPPNMEDAVLHALARFAYDPSTREVTYCLLVIAKNWRTFNWERFLEHSEDYNLSEDAKKCRIFFQHFAEFLRKERDNSDRITRSTGLGTLTYPDFESFSELCDQYGIDTTPFSKG